MLRSPTLVMLEWTPPKRPGIIKYRVRQCINMQPNSPLMTFAAFDLGDGMEHVLTT